MLKRRGYATACIGKLDLGLRFAEKTYTDPILDGPTHHGFDYFFGISASLDMPPFVFIENDRFTEVPTVEKTWIRTGPAAKDFEAIDVLPTLTRKAVEYIASRSRGSPGRQALLPLPRAQLAAYADSADQGIRG